ncbi:hypothetical protein BDM02DRAFT_2003715 [Thelephora ganbajun]|uniref:Uncharacterized protein n=1 Tax=Thelephora ganbajun TaxID=370292 RepID=A0ACB6ZHE2_THEGA|nr:hypothetical protein BDM02DRAFT_2003715 [Thelephora ganbajun]
MERVSSSPAAPNCLLTHLWVFCNYRQYCWSSGVFFTCLLGIYRSSGIISITNTQHMCACHAGGTSIPTREHGVGTQMFDVRC